MIISLQFEFRGVQFTSNTLNGNYLADTTTPTPQPHPLPTLFLFFCYNTIRQIALQGIPLMELIGRYP